MGKGMQSLSLLRGSFINFFEGLGHHAAASAPLIPEHDPTLLFTNAGMVPFKDYFTGKSTPPHARVVSSQKCIRAGGKHNDLENVGFTARHHTFFEMLGNFSFGDYFKAEAIEWAWRFVTDVLRLDRQRLYVTVYHEDHEAYHLWRRIAGLSSDRILSIATQDNFWSMGETGPCGPCTEIFYDHGDHIAGGLPGTADEDGDRYMEIWNLVFMQHERFADGTLRDLPRPSIDTGAGLERLASVMQGTGNNYTTDLFSDLIASAVEVMGVPAEGEALGSYRVVADHLRSMCFLIADGMTPSNEGRGYVLRRIMRRAMRHAYALGQREVCLYRLVPVLERLMGEAYPELSRAREAMAATIRQEEERFGETLHRGMVLLQDASGHLGRGDSLAGEVVFKLYDTYGFPVDVVEDVLRHRGVTVDHAGFEVAMQRQRDLARRAWSGSGDSALAGEWLAWRERFGATKFLGYDHETCEALVLEALQVGDGTAWVVTDATVFYAESGGQQADHGLWRDGSGHEWTVMDVQLKAPGLVAHRVVVPEDGRMLSSGDRIMMAIDVERRGGLRAHHTAVHLLHAALRQHLGLHVVQRGSLVTPESFRFDFVHGEGLTEGQLYEIEATINAVIRENRRTEIAEKDPATALREGAIGLFGEKYGDRVRVLTVPGLGNPCYSMELCGGTHVAATGDIGLVRLGSDSSIASGVRRIEGRAHRSAWHYAWEQGRALEGAARLLRVGSDGVVERVDQLLQDAKETQRRVERLQQRVWALSEPELLGEGLYPVRWWLLEGADSKSLRQALDARVRGESLGLWVACGVNDQHCVLLVRRLGAVDEDPVALVRGWTERLTGVVSGGGKGDTAQAVLPLDSVAGLRALVLALTQQ